MLPHPARTRLKCPLSPSIRQGSWQTCPPRLRNAMPTSAVPRSGRGKIRKLCWMAILSILRKRSLLGDPELKFRSPLQLQPLSSAPCEFQDIERGLVGPILWAAVVRSRTDRDALFQMDDFFFLIHPDEIERD